MTSLWLAHAQPVESDPLPEIPISDVVVGAGLTGLATGLLLARAGRRVAVVEARYVGAVATGNTTAKVSLLQGTKYSKLLSYQSSQVASAYLEGNRDGMEWLLRFCAEHDVAFQRRAAFTYAASEGEIPDVRKEYDAARSLGLPLTWRESLDVPFPHRGAAVLEEQAQFDPMDVLGALAAQLREQGGTLHQGHRVTGVSLTGSPEVSLENGATLRAEHVVLATGSPVLDRGLFFSKQEAQRSYGIAYESSAAPEGMYLSVGSDSRSVRDTPGEGRTRLLVGGSGHVVGRTSSEAEHVDRLRSWTAEHFPDAVETHQWSAQDYSPYDAVPFVGRMPRGGGRIYAATGFDKWGMTNAVAAARSISGSILGSEPAWAKTLSRRGTGPRAAAQLATMNTKVGVAAAASVLEGVRRDRACPVLAVCTHLGGLLHWNDAERTWDCPLHGSRFGAEGEVLEGPATRPLKRRSNPS